MISHSTVDVLKGKMMKQIITKQMIVIYSISITKPKISFSVCWLNKVTSPKNYSQDMTTHCVTMK